MNATGQSFARFQPEARDRPAFSGMEFAPGTNSWGELASTDWRFLLPTLQFGSILCLGPPPGPVLTVLSGMARVVVVASATSSALRSVGITLETRDLANVYPVCTEPLAFPCGDAAFDLIVGPFGVDATRALSSAGSEVELDRVLQSTGVIYLDTDGLADVRRANLWAERMEARGFAPARRFWLLRRRGHIHVALPRSDVDLTSYFFEHVLSGKSRKARLLRQIGRLASHFGLLPCVAPGQALVLERVAPGGGAALPSLAYLRGPMARAGFDLADYRPAFFARGGYDSNKVAFFLFRQRDATPEIFVKMTRAPRYNHRLEAEYRSLCTLRAEGWVDRGTFPEPLFLDRHCGLAVLGERVVHGAPFRTRTTSRADCPSARSAIDWIIRLGAASAVHDAAGFGEISDSLAQLLTRFASIYSLTTAERDFLEERVAAINLANEAIPLVFRHADAGTWNVLVGDVGRVIFLDWETSEPKGMPLWDLFDFVRSFGNWIGRVKGQRDGIAAYAGNFLEHTALSRLQANATARYCGNVGLDRALVEPLFYTCWMQRAVREAAWTSEPPEQGRYLRLIRLCIRHRNAEGLRWLFA